MIHPAFHTGVAAERTAKYLPNGHGGLLGFELAGGIEAGRAFIDALQMFYHVANIGDSRSLAIHPASTTHSQPDAGRTARDRGHAWLYPAVGGH